MWISYRKFNQIQNFRSNFKIKFIESLSKFKIILTTFIDKFYFYKQNFRFYRSIVLYFVCAKLLVHCTVHTVLPIYENVLVIYTVIYIHVHYSIYILYLYSTCTVCMYTCTLDDCLWNLTRKFSVFFSIFI